MSEENSFQDICHAASIDESEASSPMLQLITNNVESIIGVHSSFMSNDHPHRRALIDGLELLPLSIKARLYQAYDLNEMVRVRDYIEMMRIDQLVTFDEDGYTPLLFLLNFPENFKSKNMCLVPLVEKLRKIPFALMMKTKSGESILHLAAKYYPEMSYICGYLAAVMLQEGYNINYIVDNYGNTVMHCIAAHGDSHLIVLMEMLLVLKDYPLDLSNPNRYGETVLHVAIKHSTSFKFVVPRPFDAMDMMLMLLKHGADLKVKDRNGNTALHMAIALTYDPKLVEVLLRFANFRIVNEINNNGNTPLHLAAQVPESVNLNEMLEICRLLLEARSRIMKRNNDGKTPLYFMSLERKKHFMNLVKTIYKDVLATHESNESNV